MGGRIWENGFRIKSRSNRSGAVDERHFRSGHRAHDNSDPFQRLCVMRNSFEAVPREHEEAAVIYGASSWQVLTRICLPAVRPAIVTVSLFAFITSWNEFLGALVMMNRGTTFTLPLIIANARQATSIGGTDWGLFVAGRRDHFDHSLRAFLRPSPEILCRGIYQRRSQMTKYELMVVGSRRRRRVSTG